MLILKSNITSIAIKTSFPTHFSLVAFSFVHSVCCLHDYKVITNGSSPRELFKHMPALLQHKQQCSISVLGAMLGMTKWRVACPQPVSGSHQCRGRCWLLISRQCALKTGLSLQLSLWVWQQRRETCVSCESHTAQGTAVARTALLWEKVVIYCWFYWRSEALLICSDDKDICRKDGFDCMCWNACTRVSYYCWGSKTWAKDYYYFFNNPTW